MSQFIVRKALGITFPYKEIKIYLSDEDIEKGRLKLNNNYSKIIQEWDSNKNSEWIVRNYLATKMIMSSTVMLTSLSYGLSKNIRVTEPYLIYYSLLNICRSVLFTSPLVEWKDGGIMVATHSKTINIVGDAIGQFNKEIGAKIKDILERAREYRELFSYKFPANGIGDFSVSYDECVSTCRFLAEFAQLQSEVLEKQNFRKTDIETKINHDVLRKVFIYEGEKYHFLDNEDWYRLDYISRKQPFPVNLYFTLTEGMVEDFFGAWCNKSDEIDDDADIDAYNPDDNWRLIFPMP